MQLLSAKEAEDILERIFASSPKPSALDQAEETLRHPKRLVYAAMSNRNFYWRHHIQKFILDSSMVPVSPFMLFDYYLLHTVSKNVVRDAMNNLLAKCDEFEARELERAASDEASDEVIGVIDDLRQEMLEVKNSRLWST